MILSANDKRPGGVDDEGSPEPEVITLPVEKVNRIKSAAGRVRDSYTDNPTPYWWAGGVTATLGVIWLVWFLFFATHVEKMTAESASWERKIEVEDFQPREESQWYYAPSDAYNVSRDYRYHYTERYISGYSIETYSCGTYTQPRTCTREEPIYSYREIYDWYYRYTVDRWRHAYWVTTGALDHSTPFWDDLKGYTFDERDVIGNEKLSGKRTEEYKIFLVEKNGEKHVQELDLNTWIRVTIGRVYNVNVNRVGYIRSVNW